jgi:hypothetical protein
MVIAKGMEMCRCEPTTKMSSSASANRKYFTRCRALIRKATLLAALTLLGLVGCAVSAAAVARNSGQDYEVVFATPFGPKTKNDVTSAEVLIRTHDGGYAVAGAASAKQAPPGGQSLRGNSPWLVKFDGQGVVQWQRTLSYHGPGISVTPDFVPGDVHISAISEDAGGNLLVAGWTGNEELAGGRLLDQTQKPVQRGMAGIALKYSPDGQLLWKTAIGPVRPDSYNRIFHAAVVTGGYVLAGDQIIVQQPLTPEERRRHVLRPHNVRVLAWLVKLNDAGEVVWDRRYENLELPGPSNPHRISSLSSRVNGELVLAVALTDPAEMTVYNESHGTGLLPPDHVLVLKFDRDGNEVTRTRLPVPGGTVDIAQGPHGYLVSGRQFNLPRNHNQEDQRTWCVALDDDLHQLWDKRLTGAVEHDNPIAILGDNDGWRLLAFYFDQRNTRDIPVVVSLTPQGNVTERVTFDDLPSRLRTPGLYPRIPLVPTGSSGEYVFLWQYNLYDVYLVKVRIKN